MVNSTGFIMGNNFPKNNDDHVFSTLIDAIPALVAYVDCNMILHFCNEAFKKWFSFAIDVDPPCASFPAIVGMQVFDQIQRHIGKVLIGDRAHFQISVSTSSGVQFLDATLSPHLNNRNDVTGFIFHCSDVTEKNRTERVLKDYFENASIGLHWVNSAGIIIWANPAELQMLGYTQEEYIGQHISKFHAHRHVIDDILKRLANKQTLHNYEAELLCKDGSVKYVSINSTVLWENERFVHTRCFTIDITKQKLAAMALKASEERFRMMTNLVPLVVWTSDENGEFSFLNVRWQELTGAPSQEGLGAGWTKFIHSADRDNMIRSWMKSVSQKKPFEGKFRLLKADGKYVSIYAISLPNYSTVGRFEGHIGVLQDVSMEEKIRASLEKMVLDRTKDLRQKNVELRLAEEALLKKNEELEKINDQLSSFAHIASHDLQEPLRKIQTFSNRLYTLEGDKFSEKGKQLYQRIYDSSDRMKGLINDLLMYSKSNHDEESIMKVDLNMLLQDVLAELEVKSAEKQAVINYASLPCVSAIKFQFHQLFLNLLSNALKFSKAGIDPVINVISETVEGSKVPGVVADTGKMYHLITISDNGIGFEPKSADKIFEMFHRLHSRNQYEGTGIGLAICKKIVENHGGLIVAKGQPGVGATFLIYLPLPPTDEGKSTDNKTIAKLG